ncbi:hypothetical protein PPYR_01231 [Photinus pyralis]|uniref:HTH CENPB-type domain-containing protein n=1 Tax=Photinus pyralis TaxID=7054 RepID=A0A5N4B3R7_PHOPY|nr:hypothetical protein PPYR_01231 [Photinus pyralis]
MVTCIKIKSWVKRDTVGWFLSAMGKYTRKSDRQSWDENSMHLAVEEVLEGRMGYLKASKEYGVPRSTIEARVKKVKRGVLNREDSSKKGLGRHKPVFTLAQEEELVEHILSMEARLFGLTLDQLRSLAFELAHRNGISHRFNMEKKKAGKAWLYAFLARHPNVKLRSPEPTSLARAMGFNRTAVDKFFNLLSGTLEKFKIPPERIYNVDETGIMTVPKKNPNVYHYVGSDKWAPYPRRNVEFSLRSKSA